MIDPEGKAWRDVNVRNLVGGGFLFTFGVAAVVTAPGNPLGAIGAVLGAGAAISGIALIKQEYDNFKKDSDDYTIRPTLNTILPPSVNATTCP